MATLAGTKLDKYEMLEEVGHGGMAVVYRGQDTVLRREVALKVLHAHLSDRAESRLRLQREAIAVAKLRHDNILEIYDYSGPQADQSYIVTEFIHGPTLREWMDDGFEPRPTVAALVIHRLCLALAHAHASGIIHRDIKPENVMIRLSDGCIKLMDFGIAQILDNEKLTMTGQLIGSPAYMAPELVSGRPLDARTDIFSLGIMLYQLATGELPFFGRNPHEVLNRIADGEYPAPSSISPLVDRDLEAIIAKALANSASDRYQTVDAFRYALEAYLEELGIESSPEEISAYFASPKAYVEKVDVRVCEALLTAAERAAKQGQNGRAIRYLGRILDLDGSHRLAKAMLTRLRRRERRIRQALLAAGIVAAGGFVGAGFLLIPRQPSIAAVEVGAPVASSPVVTPGPIASFPPADTELPGTADPPEAEDPVPRTDGPIAGATSGDPEGRVVTAGDTSGDPPRPPDPPESATPRDRKPKPMDEEPRRTPPKSYLCQLQIEGIPPSAARNLRVSVDQGPALPVDDDPAGTRLTVTPDEATGRAFAVLKSPRYKGHVELPFDACKAGPVKLEGTPRPARLSFEGAPSNTSVQCLAGCPANYRPFSNASSMDPIAIPPGHTKQVVTLHLSARCHRQKTIEVHLDPGPNSIRIDLEPLPPEDCTR